MDKYDTFIYSGKKVVIRKGKDFSKNEIKSRLHQMNIDFDLSENSKTYFTNLYDEALYNNSNKIKIFDKLKSDTERLGLLTNNQNYIQNNRRNFISDNEEAEEETIKNKKKEKGKKIIIKDEIINDEQLNSIYNSNERNNINSFNKNTKSDFTNVLANQIRENKQNNRLNAFEYNHQKYNNNEINYEEDIENTPYQPYNNLRNRPQDYSNFNNTNYNNKENNIQRRYDNNKHYGNANINQFQYETTEYNNSPIKKNERKKELIINDKNFNNLEKKLNDRFRNDYNNKRRLSNQYNDNYKQNNNYNNLNKNERRNNNMEIYQENESENNNNSINIPVNNNKNNLINRKRYRNYALEKINEENYLEEENLDNNPDIENKNNIELLLYILFLIIGGLLIYFVLKIIFRVSNTLTEGVTQTVRIVTNPRRLFRELIWGLIKSILMGILYEYIYITLPLAILSFVIYMLKQRREFNKLCKQIIEDIKKDLENKMDKSISENEIIDKYSKKYNIDKNIFIKKYLKALRELRKKDHSLKLSQNNNKGVTETFWELSN